MKKIRRYIAFLLLATYSIVFAHNSIPHNHHTDIFTNIAAAFSIDESHHHHHHHHGEDCHIHWQGHHQHPVENVKHEHDHEQHEACHFDVRPVASKTIFLSVLFVVNTTFLLRVPENEVPKNVPVYLPQKLPAGYCYAVPLRAPPVFA